jgi:hypothetical protein
MKINNILSEKIAAFLEQNLQTFQSDFILLKPRERARLYFRLLQYGTPRLRAISTGIDFSQMSEEQLDTIIEELRKTVMENERKEAA